MSDPRPTRSAPPRGILSTAALASAGAYAVLRLYWALGGRFAYTACDRTHLPGRAEIATGCGADTLGALPFWSGWGAVALSLLLTAVAAAGVRWNGKATTTAIWAGAAVLVVLSFPGHLIFEVPAGILGRVTDWRDLAHRFVQLGIGIAVALAAYATGRARRCGHPRESGHRPVARWARGWTYAACALPILGFTVPHLLWVLGVPFGITAQQIADVRADLDAGTILALCALPAAGGLATLGLGMRWGQVFPAWLPLLGGRRVPRLLALVAGAVIAAALVTYGVIGVVLMARGLADGEWGWSELAAGWAVFGTEFVFLAWGAALAVAVCGYGVATRPRCAECRRG